jgi:hypothetical protein
MKAHIWERQRESCTHAKTHDIVYSAFSDTKLHGLPMSMHDGYQMRFATIA